MRAIGTIGIVAMIFVLGFIMTNYGHGMNKSEREAYEAANIVADAEREARIKQKAFEYALIKELARHHDR